MYSQKAIETLIEDLDTLVDIARDTTTIGGWLVLANSATEIRGILEKQIPKKPTNQGKTFHKHWLCPTCNRLYWERDFLDNWCSSCGQRFDLELEE